MRKTLLTLLVGSMTLFASAQTSLKGTLIDESTSQPIVGATVTLANQNISTTTNQSGEFTLLYLEPMDEEVIIEAEGYNGTIELVQLQADQINEMDPVSLKQDIAKETKDEILLTIADQDLNDDEGKSQAQASAASASTDVFNSTISFAWSTARYRNRGYEQQYETVYINGVSFNTAERGTFSFGSMGGLNEASRWKEVSQPMEATNFTFGNLGQATNYLMNATRYAQGWKVSAAGTNRNYKAAVRASYSTGPMANGWSVMTQLAFRFSPYTTQKGIIGEGVNYYSLGYFLSAEKVWDNGNRLNITTFGSPTMRGQNGAVTQEVYDLTGTNNYNPYWGYQDGHIRNSRIVKTIDPTAIVSFDLNINEYNKMKFGIGYHYSLYSNSAINFYNAPDPRPDYYRNLPSFYWDAQIVNGNSEQLYDPATGKHYQFGNFIGNDMNGVYLGQGFTGNDGNVVGPSIDANSYNTLVDLWKKRDNKTTQIDWDALYAANYADPDGLARYMVERRHNDIQEATANVLWTNTKFDHLKMTLGAETKYSQGVHYKTMDDLLGAQKWVDIDPFADRDIKELATNIGLTQDEMNLVKQNNLANQNAVIKDGDVFGYKYQMNMETSKIWFQNEWRFNEIDFYYAIQGTYSMMQRSSDMINGRAWYLAMLNPDDAKLYLGNISDQVMSGKYTGNGRSLGKAHHFIDPAFKLGFTYKINGRNKIKFNALAETRAPLARNAYLSQRVHDRVIESIYTHDNAKNLKDFFAASEKIVGGDLTYEFNYQGVRGRVTGYYTRFWDGSELNGYYDDEARTFVNQAITGIDRRHCGVEAAIAVKLGTYFTLTGVAAIGDYRYTSNAYSVTSAENGMALTTDMATKTNIYEVRDSVMYNGLRVSQGPQLNASLKLSFFHPKMWFADVTVSYYDWNFLNVAPSRRMMGLYTGTRADGSTVNGGYNTVYTNHDEYIDVRVKDETGQPILDKYGNYQLQYPYNLLDQQESLSATNPLNRFLIDFSVGKLIYLKNRQSLSINLSVTNIGHNLNFKTGGYQQARLPRSTRQKVEDGENSTITANAWKFPAKYYYAWGPNLYATITYKF